MGGSVAASMWQAGAVVPPTNHPITDHPPDGVDQIGAWHNIMAWHQQRHNTYLLLGGVRFVEIGRSGSGGGVESGVEEVEDHHGGGGA